MASVTLGDERPASCFAKWERERPKQDGYFSCRDICSLSLSLSDKSLQSNDPIFFKCFDDFIVEYRKCGTNFTYILA